MLEWTFVKTKLLQKSESVITNLCVSRGCEAHRSAGPSTAVCGLSSACHWLLGSCAWGRRPPWCRTWSGPRPQSWTDSGAGHDLENSDADTIVSFMSTSLYLPIEGTGMPILLIEKNHKLSNIIMELILHEQIHVKFIRTDLCWQSHIVTCERI